MTFESALKVKKTIVNEDYDQYFTIFEQICKTAGTSEYIKLCGKYGIDMDKVCCSSSLKFQTEKNR